MRKVDDLNNLYWSFYHSVVFMLLIDLCTWGTTGACRVAFQHIARTCRDAFQRIIRTCRDAFQRIAHIICKRVFVAHNTAPNNAAAIIYIFRSLDNNAAAIIYIFKFIDDGIWFTLQSMHLNLRIFLHTNTHTPSY